MKMPPLLDSALAEAIVSARLNDPFRVLGPHRYEGQVFVRTLQPGAQSVEVIARDGRPLGDLIPEGDHGLFGGWLREDVPYLLRITWPGSVTETEDPYGFGPILGDLDLHLIGEGRHLDLWRALGSHAVTIDGVAGVRFAVWAPNGQRASVVGDFNSWDGRRHPMRLRHPAGVWELFLPRLKPGERYKYEIVGAGGHVLPQKADPYARRTEKPPATASVIAEEADFIWTDSRWMEKRPALQATDAPLSIYEVHAGSWLHGTDGAPLDWHGLADKLIPYVKKLGFTHIELLPITEHPFTGSWGYQPLGMFAPTARYGTPEGFAAFVDACHRAELGVILDWVPAHFPNDAHGLGQFDGTALYEHADPREGQHKDWGTLIYNFGRREVANFLLASALYWIEHFHIDGLRVDAVASMLYRDYSRKQGEWVPNVHGGRENLEAVAFLHDLCSTVHDRCPAALVIAEESTAWPGVTRPVSEEGLGFSYKWNMGWMHDSLQYFERETLYRTYHHDQVTFGLVYAFSEQFVLPLSHDEVVHGKGSLIAKMPGDRWQRFANLRAAFALMWAHPGKKLLFMGGEFAQEREWNHDRALDWDHLSDPSHRGIQHLIGDLNRLYREEPALYTLDGNPDGFAWIIGDDRANSIFAFLRKGSSGQPILAIANMTPVPRTDYRIGVPLPGRWQEKLNSDAERYGGGNLGNQGSVMTEEIEGHGHPQSLALTLPPLAVLLMQIEV
jgi:1,4-alpha-glucan branching enzyme